MLVPLLSLLLCLAAGLFGMWAEQRAGSVFKKYARDGLERPTTGGAAAAAICSTARTGAAVQREGKFLQLAYHRGTKTLRLSAETYDGRSITSIAKGIYEAGHALQDAQRYPWLGLRSGRVSVDNLVARYWAAPVVVGGLVRLFLGARTLEEMLEIADVAGVASWAFCWIVFVLCAGVVLVQFAGLRVGIDAAKRAQAALRKADIPLTDTELRSVRAVLDAAPWLYAGVALKAFFWVHRHEGRPIKKTVARTFLGH